MAKKTFQLSWDITLKTDPGKVLSEGRNLKARNLEDAKRVGEYHAERMTDSDGHCATAILTGVKELTFDRLT